MTGEMTPSARIVSAALGTAEVQDARGRVLQVRRPGALDRLRLFKAVGAALSQNERYLGYAMLAMCVAAIDGVPVPQPANEGQMEALVERLGDEGTVAAGHALSVLGFAVHPLLGGEVAEAGPGNGVARPG